MTKLITTKFQTHIGNQLLESLTETSNTAYYAFVAEHIPRTANVIPTPLNNEKTTSIDIYRNMIFGKRLKSSDMKLAIRNIPWVSGSHYTMYDDEEVLDDKDFYVVVDEIAFRHVYKCLDNNGNSVSTSQPDFSHIVGSNTILYETADGFRWKYMYSISAAEYDKFGTASYIPVISNNSVTANSVRGAIDIIKIEDSGKNYGNYTEGTFVGSDLRIGGNSLIYAISNSALKQTNGYYTDCLVYLNSGNGAGEYKTISNYYSNSSGSYVVVNNAFLTDPQNGTTYQINPRVEITGDGFETTNAVARALVNSLATNSIYRVEMLERGVGYFYNTANVIANSMVGVTLNANLRPIYSPVEGHGFNPAQELSSKHVCIGLEFSNSEMNTIPTDNSFEKIGILCDPKFTNVAFQYYDANGVFQDAEKIYKINPVRLNTNATMNITSQGLTCVSGDFLNQLSVGDSIYLKSSNGLAHMITNVSSITNATYLTLATNGIFACTETSVYQANTSAIAYVSNTANSTQMFFSNVEGQFGTGDAFIGDKSGAKAFVNTVIRNSETKGFETFNQLHKYIGIVTSGTYSEDELIFQGNTASSSTANASLFSVVINGSSATFYTSNQVGIFSISNTITGNTSGATGVITSRFGPELVCGSGKVISIENIDSVERANNRTESLKLFYNFGA